MSEGPPKNSHEEKPNPFQEYLKKTPKEGGLDTSVLEEPYATDADNLSEEIIEHAYRDTSDEPRQNPAERFTIPAKLVQPENIARPDEITVTEETAAETFADFLETLDVPVADDIAAQSYEDFLKTIPEFQTHEEQAMAALDAFIGNELAPALEEMEVMTWSEVLDLEEVIPGSNIILGFEADNAKGQAYMVLRAEHLSDELSETFECWTLYTATEIKRLIQDQAGDLEIKKIGRVNITENPSLQSVVKLEIEVHPNIYQAVELPAPIMIGNTTTDSLTNHLEKKRKQLEDEKEEE